jgi:hypothetical protein
MFGYNWFKRAYLTNTDVGAGITTGILVGVLELATMAILGMYISHLVENFLFFFIFSLAGIVLAPVVAVIIYNIGLFSVAVNHRAVPRWLGKRQPGPEFEIDEGDPLWKIPYFMGTQPVSFLMQQQTLQDVVIEVVTKNLIRVPTTLTVEWQPVEGELYYLSEIHDIRKALQEELEEVARAFGGSRTTLMNLVDTDLGESIRSIAVNYLNKRAAGEINKIKIDDDSPATEASYELTGSAPRWGIRIINVTVSGYDLPDDFEVSAKMVEEAKMRAQAAKITNDAMLDVADPWIERHVNPTAAMAMGADLANPNGARNIQTSNIAGYEGIAKSIIDGILVLAGKKPEPTTPAPEVAAAAQAEREANQGDQQP